MTVPGKVCIYWTLLLAIALGGCVRRHWTAPGIDGMVVDVRGHPLGGVVIDRIPRGKTPETVATSGPDGSFGVTPSRTFALDLLIGDPGYLGSYTFRKPGYSDAQVSYGVITGDVLRNDPPLQTGLRIELQQQ